MRYRNIFIDLDDTIWDFQANSRVALQIVHEKFRLSEYYPSFDEYFRVYSERNTELWAMYHHGRISKDDLIAERFRYPLRRIGVHNDRLVPILNEAYLSTLAEQGRLVPCAGELLGYLYRTYRLYVISNGFQEVQYKKIRSAGIENYFSRVILSDEVGYTKPHPGIFTFALEETGSCREDSIMIGDNYDADILGAAGYGIDQIYFNPRDKEITGTVPTYTVRSLAEIHDIL